MPTLAIILDMDTTRDNSTPTTDAIRRRLAAVADKATPAAREAVTLDALTVLEILVGMAGAHEAGSSALKSLALQADRYDTEIARLEARVAALEAHATPSPPAARDAKPRHSWRSPW